MRGLRKLSRVSLVAALTAGALVVAASPAHAATINVTFSTTGLPAGVTINVGGTMSNGSCQPNKPLSATFTSPGPGGATAMCNSGSGQTSPTYPATVTSTGDLYTFGTFTP